MEDTFNPFRRRESMFLEELLTDGIKEVPQISAQLGVVVDPNLFRGTVDNFGLFFDNKIPLEAIPERQRRFAANVMRVHTDWIVRLFADIKDVRPGLHSLYVLTYHIGSKMRVMSDLIDILER